MSWGLRGAPGGYLGSPGGPFWGLGGLRGEPRRVIGAPWEVPGELRGVLGGPWWVLGAALGGFGGHWGEQSQKKVVRFNLPHGFGNKNDAKRDPQGTHFGIQNRYKIVLKFECDSGGDFGNLLGTLQG